MLIPYLRNEHESYMIYNIKIIIFNNTDALCSAVPVYAAERLRARACMRELVWEGLVTDGRATTVGTVRSSVSSQSKISYVKTCESSIKTSARERFVANPRSARALTLK